MNRTSRGTMRRSIAALVTLVSFTVSTQSLFAQPNFAIGRGTSCLA